MSTRTGGRVGSCSAARPTSCSCHGCPSPWPVGWRSCRCGRWRNPSCRTGVRSLSLPGTTLKRYLALLEATFLLRPLPAWFDNLGKRLIKASKTYLIDTGLAAHLLGMDPQRLQRDDHARGALLENFVVMELTKLASWSQVGPSLHHFRTLAGQEVDLVLEDRAGRLVGIEIKSASAVEARDFNGLRVLADLVGERFLRGVILYTGDRAVPFDRNLLALPLMAL